MKFSTDYYVRTRHRDSAGRVSEWSPACNFRTKNTLNGTEVQKTPAYDAASSDYFGYAVAMSKNGLYLAIGSPNDDDRGANSGAVYVYFRNGVTWTIQAKLTGNETTGNDQFGQKLTINDDGSRIAVGVPLHDYATIGVDVGVVYVFDRTGVTWSQRQKLMASSPAINCRFGCDVSFDKTGNTLAVGEVYSYVNSSQRGAVYIFTAVTGGITWTQRARITASDAATSDYFGISVSLSGNGQTLVVGANGDDDNGFSNSGSAYVFNRVSDTTWNQIKKLYSPTPAVGDNFGRVVKISSDGNYIAVSGYSMTSGQNTRGFVVIFKRTGVTAWGVGIEFTSNDAADNDYFGNSISINGDGKVIAVAAYSDDDKGNASGSVYLFTRSGDIWTQEKKLVASDGGPSDYFGFSIGMSDSGGMMVVGAYGDDDSRSNAGAFYVFT